MLPPNLRWTSLASAGVLGLALWALAGFMVLDTIGNLASGSLLEKSLTASLTVLLATTRIEQDSIGVAGSGLTGPGVEWSVPSFGRGRSPCTEGSASRARPLQGHFSRPE